MKAMKQRLHSDLWEMNSVGSHHSFRMMSLINPDIWHIPSFFSLPGVSAQPGCIQEKWMSLCWEAHLSVRITCCLCTQWHNTHKYTRAYTHKNRLQQNMDPRHSGFCATVLNLSPLLCSARRPWCRQTSPSQTGGRPRSASAWACRLTTRWSGKETVARVYTILCKYPCWTFHFVVKRQTYFTFPNALLKVPYYTHVLSQTAVEQPPKIIQKRIYRSWKQHV